VQVLDPPPPGATVNVGTMVGGGRSAEGQVPSAEAEELRNGE